MDGRWWKVLGPSKRAAASLFAIMLVAVSPYSDIAAQASCSEATRGGSGPIRRAESRVNSWDLQVIAENDCRSGVHVELTASRELPGDLVSSGRGDHHFGPS